MAYAVSREDHQLTLRRSQPPRSSLLALAVDSSDAGEIYIARFLPRVKVTDKDDQKLSFAEDGITWAVTLTAFLDSTLGYSERFLFGGPGFGALLTDTGFTVGV